MPSKLILIVDDDLNVRFVFAAILNFDGYRVIEAVNGEFGVADALHFHPDLVLMDFDMPVMNGLVAAELIRANEATRMIPMIMITSSTLSDSETDRVANVFSGILAKPITPREVAQAVSRLIGPPGTPDDEAMPGLIVT
jgi:CheY-like chemotaxis protein